MSNKGKPEEAQNDIKASLNHYAAGSNHKGCLDLWCRSKQGLSQVKNLLPPAVVKCPMAKDWMVLGD